VAYHGTLSAREGQARAASDPLGALKDDRTDLTCVGHVRTTAGGEVVSVDVDQPDRTHAAGCPSKRQRHGFRGIGITYPHRPVLEDDAIGVGFDGIEFVGRQLASEIERARISAEMNAAGLCVAHVGAGRREHVLSAVLLTMIGTPQSVDRTSHCRADVEWVLHDMPDDASVIDDVDDADATRIGS
jgi:hypothetical protein